MSQLNVTLLPRMTSSALKLESICKFWKRTMMDGGKPRKYLSLCDVK